MERRASLGPKQIVLGIGITAGLMVGVYLGALAFVAAQKRWTKPEPDTFVPFEEAKPAVGDLSPEVAFTDLTGTTYTLKDYLGKRPVVIEFGNVTCPYCTSQVSIMDEMAKKFAGEVEFWFVYIKEAHPTANTPQWSTEDQLADRATKFAEEWELSRRMFPDGLGSSSQYQKFGLSKEYMQRVIVIDTNGRIAFKQEASMYPMLEATLNRLTGRKNESQPQ